MRILAFSDIHGNEVALEKLKALSGSYDYTFICGDISRLNLFAEMVVDQGSFSNSFIIPGNWDNEIAHKVFRSSPRWIHEKRKELSEGLNVVGFGLSAPTPFHTYGELSESEIYSRMSKLKIDNNTLLMLHSPPKGYFDLVGPQERAGSESILRIIKERQPLMALFGHIHQHQGIDHLGRTTLIKLPVADAMRACSVVIEKDKSIDVEFLVL